MQHLAAILTSIGISFIAFFHAPFRFPLTHIAKFHLPTHAIVPPSLCSTPFTSVSRSRSCSLPSSSSALSSRPRSLRQRDTSREVVASFDPVRETASAEELNDIATSSRPRVSSLERRLSSERQPQPEEESKTPVSSRQGSQIE
jgi:hypothetical protein